MPLILGTACLVGGVIFVLPTDDNAGSGSGLAVYSGFGELAVSVFGWLLIILGVAMLVAVLMGARKRTTRSDPSG